MCAVLSIGLECYGSTSYNYNESIITDYSTISNRALCVINASHNILCMGSNTYNMIDDSSVSVHLEFTQPSFESANQFSDVAVSYQDICVVDLSEKIYCRGNNNDFQGNSNYYGNIISLKNGYSHFCFLTDIGELRCFGENTVGQTGASSTAWSGFPTLIDVGTRVIDFDSGHNHNCLVTDNNLIYCWGKGASGRLGNGYSVDQGNPQLIDAPSSASFVKVSAGYSHTCAMLVNNEVMCWGDNANGQLGDGTTNDSLIPVIVSVIPQSINVVDVVAGLTGTCVIDDMGGVWCWGDNTNANSPLLLNSSISTTTTPQPARFSESTSLLGVLPVGVISGAPLNTQPATIHRLYAYNSGGLMM